MNRSPLAAVLSFAAAPLLLAAAPAFADSGTADQPAAAVAEASAAAPAEPGCTTAADSAADLFGSGVEPAQCAAAPAAAPPPEPADGPPFKRGFCQCGCGVRCESSADCGGSPCRLFVTCC